MCRDFPVFFKRALSLQNTTRSIFFFYIFWGEQSTKSECAVHDTTPKSSTIIYCLNCHNNYCLLNLDNKKLARIVKRV